MKLLIQHGQTTFEMQAQTEELVQEIMARLETICGVLVRQQKLILKGKVLDSRATLSEAAIKKDGTKIMLIASAGGGPTQVPVCGSSGFQAHVQNGGLLVNPASMFHVHAWLLAGPACRQRGCQAESSCCQGARPGHAGIQVP